MLRLAGSNDASVLESAVTRRAVRAGDEADTLAQRAFHVTVASLMLLCAAPVILVAALAIRLTSPGPVIYRQVRVGLDRRRREHALDWCRRGDDLGGQPFTIYKLRTMRADAEAVTGPVWASPDDPRVTPVGRFLRATRIDELPQLVNVIRGDMNLVGPRPERPSIVLRLRDEVPGYALRHRCRPGITGLAQVSQHYDQSVDDVVNKVRYDLVYQRRRGLWTDLAILLRTVPVVLKRQGAV
jgi:lipopolysaccharide/colanic/teichoic acid biosynthesis glycosyltransferase